MSTIEVLKEKLSYKNGTVPGTINQSTEESNWELTEKEAFLHPEEKTQADPIALARIIDNNIYPVATLGNFIVVTGKGKSKKTYLVAAMAAAMISNQSILGFTGMIPEGKVIIWIDTEQGRHHAQRVQKNILTLGETTTHKLRFYCLRKYSSKERFAFVQKLIESTPNVGAVIIDGIRDLADDPITDPQQANEIITMLMRLTEEKHCHIITVLHQNKGDSNVRGHIGTESINKSETIISVTRDTTRSNVSHVEVEFSRDIEFPAFSFEIGEDKLPKLIEDLPAKSQRGALAKSFEDFTPIDHKAVLDAIFATQESFTYSELIEAIKANFLIKKKTSLGTNKVKEFKIWYEEKGWVKRDGKEKSKSAKYMMGGFT